MLHKFWTFPPSIRHSNPPTHECNLLLSRIHSAIISSRLNSYLPISFLLAGRRFIVNTRTYGDNFDQAVGGTVSASFSSQESLVLVLNIKATREDLDPPVYLEFNAPGICILSQMDNHC